jgi:hypothetical protein
VVVLAAAAAEAEATVSVPDSAPVLASLQAESRAAV